MPRHKPKAPEDAMDDAYSESDDDETPSTGYIGAHESTPFEPYDALPDVGMSLPQPEPTDLPISVRIHEPQVEGGPLFQIVESPPPEPEPLPDVYPVPPAPESSRPSLLVQPEPEVVLGEAPRIVHSEPPTPPETPTLAPVPEPRIVPEPVDLSSPAVMACLQDIMTRIRDDPTYARNLRVRLATMQSNDQGPLTRLIDVIRGE